MSNSFGIVDLFAGPGGLGEGFASYRDQSSGMQPYSIEISIEKDTAAHATLLLRSFLRKFGEEWPSEYYDYLNGKLPEPDWSTLYPNQWKAAGDEAYCMELGTGACTSFLTSRITEIRNTYGGRTILIGGPPCQAYSLVGRSRNAGITGYLPHEDERNFLYQKYVDVLKKLKPAAFVMENVKGMLSSAIRGDRIFHKVMADLKSATGLDSYKLLALVSGSEKVHGGESKPQDFVVRMEDHGVPQARHRVIILGIRQDLASGIRVDALSLLPRHGGWVRVQDVIETMPKLRSGLSRGDDWSTWQDTVVEATKLISDKAGCVPEQYRDSFNEILSESSNSVRTGPELERVSISGTGMPKSCPEELRKWIVDPRLGRLPNHDTRSHMLGDIERYLFAAAFGHAAKRSPKAEDFPVALAPNHRNWHTGKFADRFRVQVASRPASTITSHISKDGHYYIHPDPAQCRSLTVREAARLQTFPDNYLFKGTRTQQYVQVGNAVPPFLARQIAQSLWQLIGTAQEYKGVINKILGSNSIHL